MLRVMLGVLKAYLFQKKVPFSDCAKYFFSPKGELVNISINGVSVWIRKGSPDLYVALGCLYGEFEILRKYFSQNYSGVIVDAGGYTGLSTLALRELFPNAFIVVIEPSLENLQILKKNLADLEDVEIVHGALVGRGAGPVELKNRGTGEWGYTAVHQPLDNVSAETMHSAPAVTLSSLGYEVEDIGILKLDIEGGEFDLLTHDVPTMSGIGAVYIELHDRIIDGCQSLFFDFSKDRVLIKNAGEKYLSLKRDSVNAR